MTTGLARAAFLALALCWSLVAGAEVPVPPLTVRVTDQTATLTTEQKAALERTLQAFETRKGSQLAVLIVLTTAAETIEQYTLRVAEQWKLGRRKIDDGAILAVAMNDRTLRIEVGYGLEGALNDATSKRIISEIITPRFKQGYFHGGIAAGVDRMIRVIDGEPLPEPRAGRANDMAGIQQFVPVLFVLAFVVGRVLRVMFGRWPGALVTGDGGGGFGGHRGGFGSGGFGGGSGGGFSGGGGASGRW